jgi:agmatinase
MKLYGAILGFAAAVAAHGDHDHDQEPMSGPHGSLWYNTLPGDGGTQVCFVAACGNTRRLIRSV